MSEHPFIEGSGDLAGPNRVDGMCPPQAETERVVRLSRGGRTYLAWIAIIVIWSIAALQVVRKLYAQDNQTSYDSPSFRYKVPRVSDSPTRKKTAKWKAPRLSVSSASPSPSPYPRGLAQLRALMRPAPTPAPEVVEAPLPSRESGVAGVNTGSRNFSDATSSLFGTEELTSYSQRTTGVESKWRVSPYFRFSVVYDTNPNLDSNNKRSDVIYTLTPGVSFRMGSDGSPLFLFLDYNAGIVIFGKNSSGDSLDHRAKLNFRWTMPKLTLGLNLGFQSLTAASTDLGDRVRRQTYYGGFTSSYTYNEKLSFDLNADHSRSMYSDPAFVDSNETRIQGFVNYQLTEKIQLGLGGTFGFVDVSQGGKDQTYEQALFRVIYAATEKLAFNASAGGELRQTDDGDVFSPVFSLGAVWKPTDSTSVSLEGRRRTYASAALVGQDYEATGLTISVRQRFLQRFYLSLAAGYEHTEYIAVQPGIVANRVDDYYFIRPSFDWDLSEYFSVGLFYEHDESVSSGVGARPFTRDLFGAQFSLRY